MKKQANIGCFMFQSLFFPSHNFGLKNKLEDGGVEGWRIDSLSDTAPYCRRIRIRIRIGSAGLTRYLANVNVNVDGAPEVIPIRTVLRGLRRISPALKKE
jgi:hypothetical protein